MLILSLFSLTLQYLLRLGWMKRKHQLSVIFHMRLYKTSVNPSKMLTKYKQLHSFLSCLYVSVSISVSFSLPFM